MTNEKRLEQRMAEAQLKQKREMDAARQAELDATHGRAVGGLRLPVVPVDQPYTTTPDNVPSDRLEKR